MTGGRIFRSIWITGLLVLVAGTAASGQAQQYQITTIAGRGDAVLNTVPALQTGIGLVNGVATDPAGNVYFASCSLQAVFKVDTHGQATRIAGNYIAGYSGDGGPATSAQLSLPCVGTASAAGLAIDGSGNLFIADSGNNRIRRVSPDGIITTVAGNGNWGFSGDAGDATAAQLAYPSALALDRDGNLFIADVFNYRVRKVSTSGIITTVTGNGSSAYSPADEGRMATSVGLNYPAGIAVDRGGNLYIADLNNKRIRRVTPDGIITTVAGGGSVFPNYDGYATDAQLGYPIDVAADTSGVLYISELNAIVKVTAEGIIGIVAGNGGPIPNADLKNVYAVKVDSTGNLIIADSANFRVRKIASGAISDVAGDGTGSLYPCCIPEGDGGPAAAARLAWPKGIAVDASGTLWIADTGHNQIRKISPDGTIRTIGGTGEMGFSGDYGPAVNARLNSPIAPILDRTGNLFFIDSENSRVRKISPDGTITTVAGNGKGGSLIGFSGSIGDGGLATNASLSNFAGCNSLCGGLALDQTRNLYIADPGYLGLRRVSSDGIINTIIPSGSTTSPQLGYPTAVAVDRDGNVLIADPAYGRVRKLSPAGILTTVAGSNASSGPSGDAGPAINARLSAPAALTTDSAGNLYIADPGWNFFTGEAEYESCCDNRIRRVTPDGIIDTIAGTGSPGFSGDGGPASTAALNGPLGLAVDSSGNIYFTDAGNLAVRMLHPTGRTMLIGAVVDAARENVQAISPGKIVVIYGSGLGPAQMIQNQPVNGRIGTQVGGTSVSFNGIPAPVLYASATQAAAVAPYAIGGADGHVTVSYNGNVTPDFTVPVALVAPSLFTANQAGFGQAAAINVANGRPNSAVNPVRIGDYISLYATGEGQTSPAGVDGLIVNSTSIHPPAAVTVTIDGLPAYLQYAGGAPGMVAGAMQVNVQIPAGVRPGGYVPVVVQVSNQRSSPAVWIAVTGN